MHPRYGAKGEQVPKTAPSPPEGLETGGSTSAGRARGPIGHDTLCLWEVAQEPDRGGPPLLLAGRRGTWIHARPRTAGILRVGRSFAGISRERRGGCRSCAAHGPAPSLVGTGGNDGPGGNLQRACVAEPRPSSGSDRGVRRAGGTAANGPRAHGIGNGETAGGGAAALHAGPGCGESTGAAATSAGGPGSAEIRPGSSQ